MAFPPETEARVETAKPARRRGYAHRPRRLRAIPPPLPPSDGRDGNSPLQPWTRARLLVTLAVAVLLPMLLVGAGEAAVASGWYNRPATADPVYGIDFSCRQAEWLGVDCHTAYLAILDQLDVRHVRLSAYWSEIEPSPGQYDFSELDWQIQQAADRGVDVTLSVGIKGQRAPEFYLPDWVRAGRRIPDGGSPADDPAIAPAALDFVRVTVEHEAGRSAIEVWQVENEPYVHFWRTAHDWSLPQWFVAREAAEIRAADPAHRPLLITHASWLRTDSTWQQILQTADVVGEAVYSKRQRGPLAGIYLYPFRIGPLTPDLPGQERTAKREGKAVWISELQAEPFEAPWVDLQQRQSCAVPSISPALLRANLTLAARSGAERAYLWGAEWWYYCLTVHDDPSLWQIARQALAASAARESRR